MEHKLDRDYTKWKLSREDILWEIRQRCMKEMYAKAQPSENCDDIYAYYRLCKEEGRKPEQVYHRYYLSEEEFKYIEEKYLDLYKLVDSFKDDCNVIIRDMKEGCCKDKYIEEYTDKEGNWHPGHRGYENVKPLKDIIGEEAANKVIEFIEDRKSFYRFDMEEQKFRFSIALSDSPTSNAQEVIDYWKSKGKDIEIDPRHHDSNYFWCEENGCLEEEQE